MAILGLAKRYAVSSHEKRPQPDQRENLKKCRPSVTVHSLFGLSLHFCSLHASARHHQQVRGRQLRTTKDMSIRSLQIPSNDATQRLEQAFQLIFQSPQSKYCQLCKTFKSLGGLPRAWLIKGESGSGITNAPPFWFALPCRIRFLECSAASVVWITNSQNPV